MMFKIYFYLVFVSSFVFGTITLDKNTQILDDFIIEYYYDESALETINDIAQKKFSTRLSNNLTLGYLDGASWFKFQIKNNSTQDSFILHFSEAIWKKVDLYTYEDKEWIQKQSGLDIPLQDREIKDTHPSFELAIAPNETKTFFIRGESISGHLGGFEILSKEYYFDVTRLNIIDLYIIFSFALFSILLINIYSYFLTKEKIYIYYITYNFVFILFGAMQSGFYLLFGFSGWNEGLHFIGSLVILTLLLFSQKFLDLENHLPKINKLFDFSLYLFIVFGVLLLLDVPHITLIFNIFSTIFFLTLLYAVVKVFKMGYISAKYYLLALITPP